MGEALLSEVEDFLREFGITPSGFGRRSLGDPALVGELRAGRRVWPETAARIRAFMAREKARKTRRP